MASDEDIAKGLESLFRETNPNSFSSLNEVFLRLQSKLGFDLSHKIDFIRAHISLLFASPNPNALPLPPPLQPPQHTLFHHPPPPSPHSYFPTGPTEISFALPGSGTLFAESLASPTAKESIQSKPKRRGGPGGLNKLCGVTPQLQAIVGQPALPRTEIVKQLWAYIRKNNLQDPSNKRKIICNDELRLVFEVDCTDMFQMNKLLSKHIVPLDPTKVPEQPSKKAKVEEADVPSTEPIAPAAPVTPASPIAPAAASAVTPTTHVPLVISEVLAKFFGTSEKEMPQSEVYTRIEEYIKTEGLEDPLNSMVICDTKLQELLGCESIPSHGICEALARNHLFPRE